MLLACKNEFNATNHPSYYAFKKYVQSDFFFCQLSEKWLSQMWEGGRFEYDISTAWTEHYLMINKRKTTMKRSVSLMCLIQVISCSEHDITPGGDSQSESETARRKKYSMYFLKGWWLKFITWFVEKVVIGNARPTNQLHRIHPGVRLIYRWMDRLVLLHFQTIGIWYDRRVASIQWLF